MTVQPAAAEHDALFFSSPRELADAALPFLRAGLDAGESVVLACTGPNTELLLDGLGSAAGVAVLARSDVYSSPPGAVATYVRTMQRQLHAGATGLRLVSEIDFRDQLERWVEWSRYEAVVNVAFRQLPLQAVCAYDTRTMPARVLADAELTHPMLRTATARTTNPSYLDPAEFLRSRVPARDPLLESPPLWCTDAATEVALIRQDLRAVLAATGLSEWTIDAFVMAVNEIVSNALLYGAPPVEVRLWSRRERTLCTVTDHGPGFDDPFAGYLYVGDTSSDHGRGLWLARQLCDVLEVSPEPDGVTVRLHLRH